jgi:hypothetical protein
MKGLNILYSISPSKKDSNTSGSVELYDVVSDVSVLDFV